MESANINCKNYWFKAIEHHQQTWAFIVINNENDCRIYFLGDTSSIIEEMVFPSSKDAIKALQRNAFHQFSKEECQQKNISPPTPPYERIENVPKKSHLLGWYRI
ncbi:MAG: hypothetical protein OQL19_02845 [Gammaproteobacteria bacterium]|nr:hypothetical protein [Gammaproteobacteria bacterium]